MERRQTRELNEKRDAIVKKNEAIEREYTDKRKKLESEISYLENKRNVEKSLSDMDKRELQRLYHHSDYLHLPLKNMLIKWKRIKQLMPEIHFVGYCMK